MRFARENRSGKRGIPTHAGLLMACNRLLATEAQIMKMPKKDREWFMEKPGHQDCFDVARGLKELLIHEPIDKVRV